MQLVSASCRRPGVLTVAALVLLISAPVCITAQTASASSSWEYRLAGTGATQSSGRLEARPDSSASWGTVCDDSFDFRDAFVACRSLGLPSAGASYSTVSSSLQWADSSQPIVMDDVACQGTESSMAECYFLDSSSHNCGHSEDVWLTCAESVTSAWEYRLAGSNATAPYGRLEVRPNASSAWGTVCSSSFYHDDAVVACRSAGMPTTAVSYRRVTESEQGSSSQPIWVSGLTCYGIEADLSQCSAYTSTSCTHADDMLLYCGPATYEYRLAGPGATATAGRLEARASPSDTWGVLCSSLDFTDAIVACRSLGLSPVAVQQWWPSTGSDNMPSVFHVSSCSGSEASLTQCRGFQPPALSSYSSSCSSPLHLSCGPRSTWEFQLAGTGTTTTTGRIELRPNSSAPWGIVDVGSSSSNDRMLAAAACRSLGLVTAYPQVARASSVGMQDTPGIQPAYWRAGYSCAYDGVTLASCGMTPLGFDTSPSTTPMAVHCPPISTWEYRLAGESTGYSGRLEVRTRPNEEWGTVCGDSDFGVVDAMVACRSLGLPTTAASFTTATLSMQGASSQPVLMSTVRCSASQRTLEACEFYPPAWHTCGHEQDVFLSCPHVTHEYHLAGGNSTYGRLEARIAGTTDSWGTVCGSSNERHVAVVACRSLGLSSAAASLTSVPTALSVDSAEPVAFAYLNCDGNETTLDACDYTPSGSGTCGHYSDLALSCPTTSYEYRLTGPGATSATGRLEVRPDASSAWGTVYEYNPTWQFAAVACRSLGLPAAGATAFAAANSSLRGDSSQPVAMRYVHCGGTEQQLDQCFFQTTASTSHYSDVMLSCPGAISPEYRLVGNQLHTRSGPAGTWGTMCRSLSSTAAAVACRSLGLPTSAATSWYSYSYTTSPPIDWQPGRFDCNGTETSLEKCMYEPTGWHSNCGSSVTMLSCTDPNQWQYRHGTSQRLEVRPNASAAWGSVCLYSSSAGSVAAVACRSLGLSPMGASMSFTATSVHGSDVAIGSVTCAGNEQSLARCDYQLGSTSSCAPAELTCSLPSAFEYRLAGTGATVNFGRVEARAGPAASWGTVCTASNSRKHQMALVACRSLGLPLSGVRVDTSPEDSMRGPPPQPIVFQGLSCNGDEATLAHCGVTESTSSCGHYDDLVVMCGFDPAASTGLPPSTASTLPMTTTVSAPPFSTTGPVSTLPLTTSRAPVATRPATPVTIPPGVSAVIRSEIRIAGTAFGFLLADSDQRATLIVAVRSDLAALLLVPSSSIVILDMYEGSLVVDFAVDESSGADSSSLGSRLATAGTRSWLTSTQTAYSAVSSETLTAQVTSVSAAPTTTPPPPTPSPVAPSDSGDSGVPIVIIAAAAGGVVLVVAIIVVACVCCRGSSPQPQPEPAKVAPVVADDQPGKSEQQGGNPLHHQSEIGTAHSDGAPYGGYGSAAHVPASGGYAGHDGLQRAPATSGGATIVDDRIVEGVPVQPIRSDAPPPAAGTDERPEDLRIQPSYHSVPRHENDDNDGAPRIQASATFAKSGSLLLNPQPTEPAKHPSCPESPPPAPGPDVVPVNDDTHAPAAEPPRQPAAPTHDETHPQNQPDAPEPPAVQPQHHRREVAAVVDVGLRPAILLPKFAPPDSFERAMLDAAPMLPAVTQLDVIVEQCAEIAKDRCDAGRTRLEYDAALALALYTFDLGMASETEDGSDNLGYVLDDVFHVRDPRALKALKPFMFWFKKAWTQLPPVTGTGYRAIQADAVAAVQEQYSVGRKVYWSSITTLTLRREEAVAAAGEGGVVMEVALCDSRSIGPYAAIPRQDDAILEPNVQLIVTQTATLTDGVHVLKLTQVKQEKVFVF